MASLLLFVSFLAPLIPPTISTSMHAQYHDQSNIGFQTTLIHVDHDKRLTKTELLRRTLERGTMRVLWLQSKITAYPTIETAILDASGEYLMRFSIGTPNPSPITAIMDTGSDLIWTQCKPCNPCINQSTPIFDPNKSLSYSKLGCSTNLCKALSQKGLICKNGYCNYYYSYKDNSSTRGALATETFTFDGKVKVLGIGFGCGFSTQGYMFTSSGTVGLGRGALSLVSQMDEARFSYCLPTFGSGGTGALRMGCHATNPPGVHVNTTPLIKNPYKPYNYYYISLEGITIGQTRLAVDKSTFAIRKDGSWGMIIDSGTTLTYLVESAFDQVKKELTRQLGLNTVDGSDIGLDVCFNITSHHSKRVKFPVIVFHFGNGVNLELTRKNYILTDSGVGCLVMGNSNNASIDFSILGSYQQQNTLVVYDLAKESLSFLPNYRNCGGYKKGNMTAAYYIRFSNVCKQTYESGFAGQGDGNFLVGLAGCLVLQEIL